MRCKLTGCVKNKEGECGYEALVKAWGNDHNDIDRCIYFTSIPGGDGSRILPAPVEQG